MSLRIVFAGTPQFAEQVLQQLVNTEYTVVGVYTQPDRKKGRGQKLMPSPVKTLAITLNIPVYQPARLKEATEQEMLKSLDPDLMVVVAYGLILPAAVLAIPKYGCINIHASNLPRWRGAAPIQRAILANDPETGICIMQMDAGLDTGDVLNKVITPIDPKDTSETLHHRLANLGAKALIETLRQLEAHTLHPQKQDDTQANYATKINKEEAVLDWSQSAKTLDCKIRAFNPWPIASTQLDDLNLRVFSAEPLECIEPSKTITAIPGTILEANHHGIVVMTGQGTLRLLELQLPGGKCLSVRDILHSKAHLFHIGQTFHS